MAAYVACGLATSTGDELVQGWARVGDYLSSSRFNRSACRESWPSSGGA